MSYSDAIKTIFEIRDAWEDYKDFLMEKYPTKEGEEWKWTCPHHQKIDDVLNEKV